MSNIDPSSAAAIAAGDGEAGTSRSGFAELARAVQNRLQAAFASFRRSEPRPVERVAHFEPATAADGGHTAELRSELERRLSATLQEVLQRPTDPEPRETHAAILKSDGNPRGDFILAQLQYARLRDDGALAKAYCEWREAERLFRSFGHSWDADVRAMSDDHTFYRGFVELVKMPAARFLQNAETLFAKAPILHLDLTDVADVADELFNSHHLTKIRSLAIDDCGLTDRDMRSLAESHQLTELRWLSLAHNCIDHEGVEALASRWKSMPNLGYINFFGNLVDPTEKHAHDGGEIVYTWLPDDAQELERTYRPPWLTLPRDADGKVIPPDRFALASRTLMASVQSEALVGAAV